VRLFEPQLSSGNIVTEFCCPHRTVRSPALPPPLNQDGEVPADLLDHECNCGSVYGVPNEFKQVVLNLLSNARDAILARRSANKGPEEGTIGVSIYSGKKNSVIIDFSDNGCGIPADAAPRIFDPYFTTKEESGGTGIGLYMSRMIVEDSLGGRLRLVKGKGGTLFRIELPQKEIA
jgi:signal transduction histidine kinase